MFNLKKVNYRLLIAIILISKCIWASAEAYAQTPSSITIPYSANHSPESPNYYYEAVLKLALEKTAATSGKVDIKFYPFETTRDRQRAILKIEGGLDVIWGSPSSLREDQLVAININLLRDLSNYKILLIRKADKEKFAAIRSLADLRKFKAGTGSDWQDTKILQRNSIPLLAVWDYESMFTMLVEKRFDYMMRGPQEIWPELAQHKDLPLIAEEKLLIRYTSPIYFFVNAKNAKLAARIKAGLTIAEKDGSLNRLFMSLPAFKKGYEESHSKHRILINMDIESE